VKIPSNLIILNVGGQFKNHTVKAEFKKMSLLSISEHSIDKCSIELHYPKYNKLQNKNVISVFILREIHAIFFLQLQKIVSYFMKIVGKVY
jgi:hypothetical protein